LGICPRRSVPRVRDMRVLWLKRTGFSGDLYS
jgi:hypothetical protein